jgi:hypothetical protein
LSFIGVLRPLGGLLGQLRREVDWHDDRAVVVGDDQVAGHNGHAAAGDRHVVGERHQAGLGVEVRRDAAQPQTEPQLLDLGRVADGAVDHHAGAALAAEVGHHHLAEHAAGQVAARVHDHHVAGLGVVQHVAVDLRLRVHVLGVGVQVLALRHELQRHRRTHDGRARRVAHRPDDVRAAHPEPLQLAGRGRAPDVLQRLDELLRWALDIPCFDRLVGQLRQRAFSCVLIADILHPCST